MTLSFLKDPVADLSFRRVGEKCYWHLDRTPARPQRYWWHCARPATITGMDAPHPAGPPPAIQPDPLLYPEVAAANGNLGAALRNAAADMHVDLGTVSGPESPTDSWRLIVASVDASRGSVVVTLGQQERVFDIRIWWTGVGEAARGRTAELRTVVDIAHSWQARVSVRELGDRWPFLEIDELTLAHERGEAVAFKWQLVRNAPDQLIDHDIVEAAYANPVLRSLFPLISHGSLQFSRCTRSPWSYDVPSLSPQLGGGWRALRAHKGRDIPDRHAQTPEEAVAFVVEGLPDGCGPAVEGPADLLLQ
ncbi:MULTISPECIES: DUF6193 family natural product biosynthesis protein [unclassified Streptomyces]|uniref:DUF6193 family natural product biosynthesis protein n=1 Tax=unclassified Streptomyces TaxID=2593676 RepID=UPI00117D32B2|nr:MULTISPECIES: DUF6193 family natural product biosynthesis protein [unclassified Streptomyces]TRO57401.1 hypothetical protein E4K73_43070 [Streptomyces sp. IB201691-2A2]